jgi:hypothetical protein
MVALHIDHARLRARFAEAVKYVLRRVYLLLEHECAVRVFGEAGDSVEVHQIAVEHHHFRLDVLGDGECHRH